MCRSVLQCVAACCSVLQRVAVCCSVRHTSTSESVYERVSVLQCVAVCCSVLQSVAVRCAAMCCSVLQCVRVFDIHLLVRVSTRVSNYQHSHTNTLTHFIYMRSSTINTLTRREANQASTSVCPTTNSYQCVQPRTHTHTPQLSYAPYTHLCDAGGAVVQPGVGACARCRIAARVKLCVHRAGVTLVAPVHIHIARWTQSVAGSHW